MLRPGDTVLLPADGYYSVRSFASDTLEQLGVRVTLVPTAGPYPSFDGVRLVLLETPANPGLDVADIAAVAAAAHAAGALVAVDNTTATPLGQRPLDLGADVVVASGTKALTGHSDLLLGYLATRDAGLRDAATTWRNATGGVPGAFDCWLAHRSLATLDLRLARQTANARALADLLAARPDVTGVRWPGRPDDPAYPVASAQMRRVPGVRLVRPGRRGAGWPGSSAPPGWWPPPPRSAGCTPPPTGAPSGATTRRPASCGSPAASRTPPTCSPTWRRRSTRRADGATPAGLS